MAEIHVEHTKNVWPWVVGLVVLLLLIWGAYALMDNRADAPFAERPAVTAPATAPATTAEAITPAADTATTGEAARETEPSPTDDTTPPQQ